MNYEPQHDITLCELLFEHGSNLGANFHIKTLLHKQVNFFPLQDRPENLCRILFCFAMKPPISNKIQHTVWWLLLQNDLKHSVFRKEKTS